MTIPAYHTWPQVLPRDSAERAQFPAGVEWPLMWHAVMPEPEPIPTPEVYDSSFGEFVEAGGAA